jgi:hypothetical protein
MTPRISPGVRRRRDAAQQHRALAGRAHGHLLQGQGPGRGRQLGAGHLQARRREQLDQVVQRAARLADHAPGADQLLDRLQGAAHQHRGGDDRARRDLLVDRQPGAQAQGRRLQEHAGELGGRRIAAAGELGLGRQVQAAAAVGQLPLAQGAAHAQGAHDLAVGGGGFLRGVGLGLGDEGLAGPRRVARSLSTASTTSTAPPTMVIAPSAGWIMKATST